MNRLSNNQKSWGPFTVARWNKKWIEAKWSGGDEEDPENTVFLCAFGWALRIHVPGLIKRPAGAGWEYDGTEYGFTLTGGDSLSKNMYEFLRIYWGVQNNGRKSKYKSWFLPWSQWRMVRHSFYNPDWTLHGHAGVGRGVYEANRKMENACPVVHFKLRDYDGKQVTATCHIEQREWRWGEGWFKWLSAFKKPFVRSYLDISYDAETGKDKGSWKGGTVGESCGIEVGESPESAIRRFCEKEHRAKNGRYKMECLGPCGPPPEKVVPVGADDTSALAAKSQNN